MICTTWMWKEISYCFITVLSPHRWPHPNITMIAACVIILIIISITRIEAHSMYSVTLFAPLGEIHCHHQALRFLWISDYRRGQTTQHNVPTLIRVIKFHQALRLFCARTCASPSPAQLRAKAARSVEKWTHRSGESDLSQALLPTHSVTMLLIISDLPADLLRVAYEETWVFLIWALLVLRTLERKKLFSLKTLFKLTHFF